MVLDVPSLNSKMEFDLIMDHSSFVTGPIGVLGIHWVLEFFQWPVCSSSEVEVDATDSCSTVN